MNVVIQGTNLDLSDDLRVFVNRKINDCMRSFGDMDLEPVRISIELEQTTLRHPNEREDRQSYRAEANISIPGNAIRVEESAMDVKQAVVKLKHTVMREVRTWRERRIDSNRKGGRKAKKIISNKEAQAVSMEKTEAWVEEWIQEEEKIKAKKKRKEDKKWEELEEGGEDERDFI